MKPFARRHAMMICSWIKLASIRFKHSMLTWTRSAYPREFSRDYRTVSNNMPANTTIATASKKNPVRVM